MQGLKIDQSPVQLDLLDPFEDHPSFGRDVNSQRHDIFHRSGVVESSSGDFVLLKILLEWSRTGPDAVQKCSNLRYQYKYTFLYLKI